MAGVSIKKVTVLNNPAPFTDPFSFEITYQATQDLDDDLEWKVMYLSSPNDSSLDQELENVMVGPITVGVYKFVLETEAPSGEAIPADDLIGTTGVVLTCSYRDQEFSRVGFFLHVDYEDETFKDSPPETPLYSKLIRNVAIDDPRVTTRPLDVVLVEGGDETVSAQEASSKKDQEALEGEETTNKDLTTPQVPETTAS